MHDTPPVDPAQSMTPLGSQVSTDRPCASCGFNLFGQMLHREPVYKLVIARCPECGTVASLQEYPAMTGWVGRWKLLLSAVWIVLLMGVLIRNFGAAIGLNHSITSVASENYADLLGFQYNEFSGGKANPNRIADRWVYLEVGWASENTSRILQEMGGALRGANREFLWGWLGASLVMFLFGVFWSVALLGARRRSAFLLPGVAIISASAMVMVNSAITDWLRGMTSMGAGDIAKQLYTSSIVPMNMGVMLIAAAIGVLAGRSIARVTVCLMLPPRLRTPLAILWTRDGLDPPKPRSV